ncbi:ARD/ARD' family-domain-containing protein [Mycena amicta]|nr:ARD/ARD' family-domain-containing protein [Mycena amicta]
MAIEAYEPTEPVAATALVNMNVLTWHIPVEEYKSQNRDTIDGLREGMGEVYKAKIKGFFEEHMHEDEEIRYKLSGSGFFDVRGVFSNVAVELGDLLVLPLAAGIYRRFTLDEKDCMTLPGRAQVHRVGYLQAIGVGA